MSVSPDYQVKKFQPRDPPKKSPALRRRSTRTRMLKAMSGAPELCRASQSRKVAVRSMLPEKHLSRCGGKAKEAENQTQGKKKEGRTPAHRGWKEDLVARVVLEKPRAGEEEKRDGGKKRKAMRMRGGPWHMHVYGHGIRKVRPKTTWTRAFFIAVSKLRNDHVG